ncbi:MAG: DUF4386 domain-containing protein [Pseudomonadota bacterium]
MVNATLVLVSAALLATSLDVAHGQTGVEPAASHLVYLLSGRLWQVGMVFFGLWLIPMGWLVLKAPFGPRALGWILIAGGVGYVLNAFIVVLAPHAGTWVDLLPLAATIGEFWMIGLLLWTGLRRTT